jgi:hypothetical protein
MQSPIARILARMCSVVLTTERTLSGFKGLYLLLLVKIQIYSASPHTYTATSFLKHFTCELGFFKVQNMFPSPQIQRRTKSGTRIYHLSKSPSISLPACLGLRLHWTTPTSPWSSTPPHAHEDRESPPGVDSTILPPLLPPPHRLRAQRASQGRGAEASPIHAPRSDMSGDRSPTVERRRGIRRLLLHPRGEASSSSPPPPAPAPEEGRRKGFATAALRGLGCTSASASQAYAPGEAAAAAAVRSSADWQGRRRRRGRDRRKERGGGGGGGFVTGGIGADVWCAPGIPFAAEASSVNCVVARHQMVGRGGRGAEGDRSHREVCPRLPRFCCLPLAFDLFVLRFRSF